MKRFWKVFITILMIAVALTELAAAGFFLSRIPIPVQPLRLDPEEIKCVRLQQENIAEKYIDEPDRIAEICEIVNAIRAPKEHYPDRYIVMGGWMYNFIFVTKNGEQKSFSYVTGSKVARVYQAEYTDYREGQPYLFDEETLQELSQLFRKEIEDTIFFSEW